MISPICDGVDGVAVVAAVLLCLLLLLAAAVFPGVRAGKLRVSTA